MLQKYCECPEITPTCCKDGWYLVLAGSRFLRANGESVENPCLRKLKEKSLVFRFTITHVPGKKHAGPDALSRNPVDTDCLLEGMDTNVARHVI